jgi:phospholipid/cholesterol/gamma-HCH transport system substrate-binding protein
MIFGKTKTELKVGIFVFAGLVVLMIFILSIGGFKTWSSGYKVKFIFSFINGVKVGAPVRFAGVDVGQVKRINFILNPDGHTKVEVVGWVKDSVNIPLDSNVWVNTLGLLGEKYIEILPGKDVKNLLLAEQAILGHDPVPMHYLEEVTRRIMDQVDDGIAKIRNKEGTLGKLIYQDTIYNELEALVIDVRQHPWKLFWKTKDKPVKK